jgi:hypothetical protein
MDSGGSSSGGGDAEAGADASDSAAPPPSDGGADAIADAEGGPPGDGGPADCAPGLAQVVYVISDMNDLYTFDPTKFPSGGAFNPVGTVPCVPNGEYVNAMAIDRHGTLYLDFSGGSIATMPTTLPLKCTPQPYLYGQAGFTNALQMAFSADSQGSSAETLYVSDMGGPLGVCSQPMPGPGCTGRGLGKLDVNTWNLTALGAFTGTASGYNALLAGTGNGDLYGMFTTTPPSYGPIDKTNGHTNPPLPQVLSSVSFGTGGYAWAFWGGDFYFFTAPSGNTVPQHLATSTGMVTSGVMLSFVVVAAASSTCAPLHPPQ